MPKMPKYQLRSVLQKFSAGHQHKRYAQQAKAYQQNTSGKVRGLRTALGAAGRLTLNAPALLRADAVRPALLREVPLAEPERFLVPELFVDFLPERDCAMVLLFPLLLSQKTICIRFIIIQPAYTGG